MAGESAGKLRIVEEMCDCESMNMWVCGYALRGREKGGGGGGISERHEKGVNVHKSAA